MAELGRAFANTFLEFVVSFSDCFVEASKDLATTGDSDRFTTSLPVEVAGRTWAVQFRANKQAIIDHTDALWSHVIVKDVMTAHPTVVRREDSLAEALRLLIQGRRRHLPVVDERGKVLGLLSIRDILTFIAGKFPEDMINLPPNPDHES